MLREKDVHEFLARAGITPTDTVLVHTSMRAIGAVLGGCDGLIDAFKSYLCDGLFIVPTHTWANVNAKSPVYDVKATVPCIGALPTVAAFRKDGVRSLHPTHSIAAFGRRAEEFLRGEEKCKTPCPPGGAWARLYDEDAIILLIGVGLDKCTYIHAVDEIIGLPDRLGEEAGLTVIDRGGTSHSLLFRGHGITGSRNFEVYRKPLSALGALTVSSLGNATVTVLRAKACKDIIEHLWKRADHDLTKEPCEITEDYYRDFR